MVCGRRGGEVTKPSEQGVLWSLGNLGKESEFKTNGREGQKGYRRPGLVLLCTRGNQHSGMQLSFHIAILLCFAFFFFYRKCITNLGAKIVIFNYSF